MKIVLIFVSIFVAGSLVLIFLTAPAQKILLEMEKGYSIEKLTYLPEGYEPISDSSYLNMGSSAASSGLIEVTSTNQLYNFIFRQMGNNKDNASVRDVGIISQFPKVSNIEINGLDAKVHSSGSGNCYVWTKNNKRYEIVTYDPFVTIDQVERAEESLSQIKIDILKPAKDFLDSFRTAE
jgi:hypothetical protein